MKTIKIIIVAQVLLLLLYNFYCYMNKTNHSAGDFIFWANSSFLFGSTLFLVSKLKPNIIGGSDKLIKLIFLISILIGVNIYVFDHLNVMVEYNTWTERQMPNKPFWKD